MNKLVYKEIAIFHPGYYVKELIDDLSMTQDELAKRLSTSAKTISKLVNGEINLTDEMALRLSIVFNTSIDMWLNLNKKFIEKKLDIEKSKNDSAQIEIIKNIDYKFWENLGLVDSARQSIDKVRELQRYLQVSDLNVLKRNDFLVQYRTAIQEVSEKNIINANAWVQTAINIGREIDVAKFDVKKFNSIIPQIRELTVQKPAIFSENLRTLLSSCGVALVILPSLKNAGVNGAVKWLTADKVILAINNRRQYADIFWFSLFHEIGHVLQRRITQLIISSEKDMLDRDDAMQILEDEADSFAQNILIHEDEYIKFINNGVFTEYSIIEFAGRINIQPGIVLGRLQKERYVPYNTTLNSIKEKYIFLNCIKSILPPFIRL